MNVNVMNNFDELQYVNT